MNLDDAKYALERYGDAKAEVIAVSHQIATEILPLIPHEHALGSAYALRYCCPRGMYLVAVASQEALGSTCACGGLVVPLAQVETAVAFLRSVEGGLVDEMRKAYLRTASGQI